MRNLHSHPFFAIICSSHLLDKWHTHCDCCASAKPVLNDVCVFAFSAGCVIKNVRETAALMFGVSVKEMVGHDLAEFIPQGCPSKNAEDLLIVEGASTKRGGLGANKKAVGKLLPLVSGFVCTHNTDKMHCSADR